MLEAVSNEEDKASYPDIFFDATALIEEGDLASKGKT